MTEKKGHNNPAGPVWILLAVAGLFLLGALTALDYQQWRALKESRAAEQQERLAWQAARQQLAELQAAAAQFPDAQIELKAQQQFIPTGSQEDSLIAYLAEAAETGGLQLMEIRFGQHVQQRDYQEIPLQVTLAGNYMGFLELLQNLQRCPRAMRIDQIKAQRLDEFTGQIEMELAASVFYLEAAEKGSD